MNNSELSKLKFGDKVIYKDKKFTIVGITKINNKTCHIRYINEKGNFKENYISYKKLDLILE